MTDHTHPHPPHPKPKAAPGGKKVFDVMRPGKAPASPTSRPVIVGHKPQIPDDQFVPGSGPRPRLADASEPHPLMDSHSKVSIAPEPPQTPAADPVPASGAPAEPTAPTASEPPALTAPEQEIPADAPASAPVAEPAVEEPRHDTEANTGTPVFMSDDDVLADTDAPELQYPVISHHRTRHIRPWTWVVIILLLVAVVAAVNFLLDAEVLVTNLDIPHTDWLK